MFPDFRLMIAAAFASVVALVCGFGVFATVHVSHAPLVRMPPALALLQQLRADNAVTLPITALEPFEHRFRLGEPANRAGISALAYAAIQPNEQPVIKAVMPLADDQDHEAAVHEPLPLPVDGEDASASASAPSGNRRCRARCKAGPRRRRGHRRRSAPVSTGRCDHRAGNDRTGHRASSPSRANERNRNCARESHS